MAHPQLEVKDKFKELVGALTGFTPSDVYDSEAELGAIERYPAGAVFLEETVSEPTTTLSSGYAARVQELAVVLAVTDDDVENRLLDLALEMEKAVIVARKNSAFPSEADHFALNSQVVTRSPEALKEGQVTQVYAFRFTQQLI